MFLNCFFGNGPVFTYNNTFNIRNMSSQTTIFIESLDEDEPPMQIKSNFTEQV